LIAAKADIGLDRAEVRNDPTRTLLISAMIR